jgi:phosphoserine phosphatase
MKKEMSAEQKAKKAAANKAYRERKKMKSQDWMELEKFEMSFDHKVRLFKNLKLELTNSYCASPGTVLNFTKIKNEDNKIIFRVKRTGRRTFFTTSEHLQTPV